MNWQNDTKDLPGIDCEEYVLAVKADPKDENSVINLVGYYSSEEQIWYYFKGEDNCAVPVPYPWQVIAWLLVDGIEYP